MKKTEATQENLDALCLGAAACIQDALPRFNAPVGFAVVLFESTGTVVSVETNVGNRTLGKVLDGMRAAITDGGIRMAHEGDSE